MIQTILLWVGAGLLGLIGLALSFYFIGYWFASGWHGYVRGYDELQKKKEAKK